jgi:hypothetical protein
MPVDEKDDKIDSEKQLSVHDFADQYQNKFNKITFKIIQ